MDEKMKFIFENFYGKDSYENLNDRQKQKLNECKSMDDLLKNVGEWGFELPEQLLENVSGGGMVGMEEYSHRLWVLLDLYDQGKVKKHPLHDDWGRFEWYNEYFDFTHYDNLYYGRNG